MPGPNELMNKRFEKARMGGYKTADVDRFIIEVNGEFSKIMRENAELKRKLESANAKLDELEQQTGSLSQALLNAQRLADNILKDAKTKSELTLRDAEIKAERLIDKAREATVSEQQKFEHIKSEVDQFRSSLLKLYKAHLEMITEIPQTDSDEASPEQPYPETAAPVNAAVEEPKDHPEEISAFKDDTLPVASNPADVPGVIPADGALPVLTEDDTAGQTRSYMEAAAAKADDARIDEKPSGNGADALKPEGAAVHPEETPVPPAEPEVKLKLKFNENSGEYVPLTYQEDSDESGGFRFGRRR